VSHRVRLSADIAELAHELGLPSGRRGLHCPPLWIAPGQSVPVARYDHDLKKRCLDLMLWGLIPTWAKDTHVVYSTIPAQVEAVDSHTMFCGRLAARRRCLVPATAFCDADARDKQNLVVALAERGLMTLGGMWEIWVAPSGTRMQSFAIVTTEVNARHGKLSDRMPVVIAPEARTAWLGETSSDASYLKSLLAPHSASPPVAWPTIKEGRPRG
jgi:putative SOS response-associated peptidase YedK